MRGCLDSCHRIFASIRETLCSPSPDAGARQSRVAPIRVSAVGKSMNKVSGTVLPSPATLSSSKGNPALPLPGHKYWAGQHCTKLICGARGENGNQNGASLLFLSQALNEHSRPLRNNGNETTKYKLSIRGNSISEIHEDVE